MYARIVMLIVISYLTFLFCSTFCKVASCHEMFVVLSGESVSVWRGFRWAVQRSYRILRWSLFAGTLGIPMRIFSWIFSGWFSQPVIGKRTWKAATATIIPLLVNGADLPPTSLLRRSVAMRQTMLNNLRTDTTKSVVLDKRNYPWLRNIDLLAALVVFYIGYQLLGMGLLGLIFWLIFWGSVWINGICRHLTTGIANCSLYVYQTEGVASSLHPQNMLDAAWEVKRA